MPALIVLPVLTVLLMFVPGYGVLLHARALSSAERMGCAGCLSAVICGTLALCCFLGGTSPLPAVLAALTIGFAAIALAYRRGIAVLPTSNAIQIGTFWLLFACELLLIEATLPSFGGAGWYADWWVQFHRSLVYANEVGIKDVARNCVDMAVQCSAPVYDNGVLTTRPPLFNLLAGISTGLDQGRIAGYQIGAVLWSSILAGPVVLLAQRRGAVCATLAGILVLANPYLVHLALYPWPKVLTGAFEVLCVYWVVAMRPSAHHARHYERASGVAAGACAVFAVYSHTSALAFVAACALGVGLWTRPSSFARRSIAIGVVAALLIISPWVVWGSETYGVRGVLLSSPTTSTHVPLSIWISHSIQGLVYSTVPMPLIQALQHQPLAGGQGTWVAVDSALEFYFDTFVGASGLVLGVVLLVQARSFRVDPDLVRLGALIALVVAAGAALLDPYLHTEGVAGNGIAGPVCLGIALIASSPAVLRGATMLGTLAILEAVFALGLYGAYLVAGPWQLNPNVIVLANTHQVMLSADLGTVGIAVYALVVVCITILAVRFGVRPMRRGNPDVSLSLALKPEQY